MPYKNFKTFEQKNLNFEKFFKKLSTTTDAPDVWFVFFFAENKDLKMCLENLNKQIKHLFLSRHCLAIIYLDNQQVFIPSKALYYPFIGKLYFGGTNLLWEKSSMEQKEVNTNTTLK